MPKIAEQKTQTPEFVLENATQKILLDFDIQTNLLNPARRSDVNKNKKKKKQCRLEDFAFQANHRVEIK